MRTPRLIALFALLIPFATAAQNTQVPLTETLPTDAKVKIGTLPNGLRYYIRQNPKPEKRAELRLVVKAGSILEDDDQRGLAHFLEHTAFNGTRNFKKNELINYLESVGIRFGADLNAYTSFDETVYMLPIPTDSPKIVRQAFQILEDWAHGQIFDPAEVTNERGVVVEEWRGRKGAGDRMLNKWLPIVLQGSRYAERLPIGTVESIQSATPDKLLRFYRDWYRPDQMAVIAVGDFNPTEIEALIKQHFSRIERRPNPRARPVADVPNNAAPLVAIATDKEAVTSSVELTFKLPASATRTVGDYRRDLVERLYISMLNSRFREIAQKPDAPFTGAGAFKGSFFAEGKDAFSLSAGAKENGIDKALEALLTEARRVDQFGFLDSELNRAKQNMLRGFEQSYTERDKTLSAALVGELQRNFLEGEAIPGIEYEYRIAQQLIPTITVAEVNALARNWITDENRIIVVMAPEKEGLKVPTETELLAVYDKATRTAVTAYTETVSDEPLIERLPAPGRVVAERKLAADVTEWRLSNGARVLFKPTDFKADEVLFQAYSPGGTSMVPNADYMSSTMAPFLVLQSGIGKFSRVDLTKKLAGKVAQVQPSLGSTSEGFTGRASPKDLETALQLVHLHFVAPRLDTAAWLAFKNQLTAVLSNRGADPNAVFSDTVSVTMNQYHPRARPQNLAALNEINPYKAFDIFKDRFADAGDFTFVFVGNVTAETLRPLAEKYLATLPTRGRKETWNPQGVTPGAPRGIVEKTVRKGTEPKATTVMYFTGPFKYTQENRVIMRALTDLFQIKLNESLREKLGGTYSPGIGGGQSRIPREEYQLQIVYNSAPENVEMLSRTVFALIDSLKLQGPKPEDLAKVKEQIIRAREPQLKTNTFWMSTISSYDQSGEDLSTAAQAYDDIVRKLTPAQIQEAAKQYFDTKNYLRFILLPEGTPPRT